MIIDVGFTGTNLVLKGRAPGRATASTRWASRSSARSSACNAVGFYRMANAEIANGTLHVPATGTASDGQLA